MSVVYKNGSHTNDSRLDPLIGASVETNPISVEGKIVSIDVETQNKSILFGVTLGVKQSRDSEDYAFTAEWLPNSVLHQNAWHQVLCDDQDLDTHYDGARSVSRLRKVVWSDSLESEAMRQLRETSKKHGGLLAISVTLYDFSYNSTRGNYSYGRVTGTIGISRRNEPQFFEGERLLSFELVDTPHLILPENDSCSQTRFANWKPFWAYRAPFKVHKDRKVLTVDFSGSFARYTYGSVRNIGDLFLGILHSPDRSHLCVELIGSIDYQEDKCHKENSCVMDYTLDSYMYEMVKKHLLVVVRPRENIPSTVTTFPLCIAPILGILNKRWRSHSHDMVVMMMERHYFTRPYRHYTFWMEKGDIVVVDLLVTSWGKPVREKTVELRSANPWVTPSNGVLYNDEAITNFKGHARFIFFADSIGYPRGEIDLEGQVYQFVYNVKGDTVYCHDEVMIAKGTDALEATCADAVTIKVFSDVSYNSDNRPYTWVDHARPVLIQYARLYPRMKKFINLGKYEEVTKPQMIHLFNYSLLLDFNHPNYMPVSRDLSAIKRAMLLEWLAKPCYNSTHCLLNNSSPLEEDLVELVNRGYYNDYASQITSCSNIGDFRQQPEDYDDYFAHTAKFDPKFAATEETDCFRDLKMNKCAVSDIRFCLQKAMELEFYTIPLYLTALYSIKDGFNNEVRSLIRSVVMQEMLHMLQVANIIISIGGKPTIDSASNAPSYPAKGLPGGVLPNLKVSLRKASPEQIHRVFTAIEYPHEIKTEQGMTIHNRTIGVFYDQIKSCIQQRGNDIFYPNSTALQIDWPYANDYGYVYKVKDVATAAHAIEEIIEQGEGRQPGDPYSNKREDLAHFFKFQEIVCGKQLQFHRISNYSFTGPLISFDEDGIWPMRDSPGKSGLIPGSKVYNKARNFHQTYRSLLRKLDQVFGGDPNGVSDAMGIMESLALQMKSLMAMPVGGSGALANLTCGPIFDYDWTE